MENLDLDSVDLTAIPSKVVTDVLSNMKSLRLHGTHLNNVQWIQLFTRMSEMSPSRLEKISLSEYGRTMEELQSVSGAAIAKVLGRCKSIEVDYQ